MRRLSHIRNIFCVKRLVARGVHGYTLLRSISSGEIKRQVSDDVRKEYIVMKTCYKEPLVMPASYAVMDEEEMMYVEGGYKDYTAVECESLADRALELLTIYSNNMSGATGTGGYAGYGIVIAMYSYQYQQYLAGSKKNGVRYYNDWNIKVL